MVNIFVYGTLRPDQSGYEWVLKQKTLEIKQSLGCLSDFGLYELEGLAKNFCVVSLTGNHLFHCLSKAISAVGVVRKLIHRRTSRC